MDARFLETLENIGDVKFWESSGVRRESSSEPTVADLVLPGMGYNFTDESACLGMYSVGHEAIDNKRTNPAVGIGRAYETLEALGPILERAGVGHSPRRLQP
jgi:hypothetical protein